MNPNSVQEFYRSMFTDRSCPSKYRDVLANMALVGVKHGERCARISEPFAVVVSRGSGWVFLDLLKESGEFKAEHRGWWSLEDIVVFIRP